MSKQASGKGAATHPRQSMRRKYEQKLNVQLLRNKKFAVERLREEWDVLKKAEQRSELLRTAQAGAKTVVSTLLALAAVGGIVTVAAMAPNAVGAAAKLWGKRGFFNKRAFQKASHYMKRRGYATVTPRGDGEYAITITDRGMVRVAERVLNNLRIPRSERWDGWWRVVVFDIPDRHKHERDMFRMKLRALGFLQLQESVFVVPYPCEEELRFLLSILNISGYARLIKAQHILDDSDLKLHFGV